MSMMYVYVMYWARVRQAQMTAWVSHPCGNERSLDFFIVGFIIY